MYKRILVPLEHSPYDETILAHIRKLAQHCGASLVLIHVADGWAARNVKQLQLRESEEMREDREYLEQIADSLESEGVTAECVLAAGNPGGEIAEAAVLLFTSPDAGRLRACPGPGCVLYFVRAHPRREWCSAVCGNRARVARHYQRHRPGANQSRPDTPGSQD